MQLNYLQKKAYKEGYYHAVKDARKYILGMHEQYGRAIYKETCDGMIDYTKKALQQRLLIRGN